MADAIDLPALTVVVPVGSVNGELDRCLAALGPQLHSHDELLVVLDGAEGDFAASERPQSVSLLATGRRSGPAAARNLGASRASNDVFVFVDADVELDPDALAIVRERFVNDARLDAVFGSYDDDPAAPGLVSQYKNLLHHFVHGRSAGTAVTFWTGCGAIRRRAFESVDGFDESYRRPSIEDIDLGMRLSERSGVVELDPTIRGKHLKRWTLAGLVVSDIRDRAVPWSELIVDRWWFPTTLNLDRRSRATATFVTLGVALLVLSWWWPPGAVLGLVALVGAAMLQLDFFLFLTRHRGVAAAVASMPVHLLYHLYSVASFGLVVLATPWRRLRARAAGRR